MHSLQKQFHDFILRRNLLHHDDKVGVAVSGGVDSMVLADLFHKSGYELQLAHCNFGLRGAESDGDQQLVKDWAERNGIVCHVKSFDIQGSVQVEARNARYAWFEELIKVNHLTRIATAHHLNDSLETTLINLARGSGIKGISGISVENDPVIRPLLFATKEEILAYANEEGINWREDASNQKTTYDRNRLRHEIIPGLEKLNPSLIKTYAHTQERLRLASLLVEKGVEAIRKKALEQQGETWRLDLNWMTDESDRLILIEILADFGVNYATARQIWEAKDKPGKIFPIVEKSLEVSVDRSCLYLSKIQPQVKEQAFIIPTCGVYQWPDARVTVEEVATDSVDFSDRYTAYFDFSSLKFPLTLRPWDQGDRLQPYGMQGSKKVSDLLIDEKVPAKDKSSVLVLLSEGQVAWVVGYRTSEAFKVGERELPVLRVSVTVS